MNIYTIIVLIFGGLTFILLFLLFFLNRLFFLQKILLNRYETISDYVDERIDLVKDCVCFIRKYLEYEDSYLKKLEKVVESLSDAKGVNEHLDQLKKTRKVIMKFLELENTYSFLNDKKEYIKLKRELMLNEDRIQYAVDGYDKGVMKYNQYRENRLIYILSKICRFPNYDYYKK